MQTKKIAKPSKRILAKLLPIIVIFFVFSINSLFFNVLPLFGEAQYEQNAVDNLYLLLQMQGEQGLGPYPYCPGSVCWNSSSITGSSVDLNNHFSDHHKMQENTFIENPFLRYRCRWQINQVLCYAYRCEQAEPAGCKQMWRIQVRSDDNFKGFDVGEDDNLSESFTPSGGGQ